MPGPEYRKGQPTPLLLSLRAWGAGSKRSAVRKGKAISKRNQRSKERSVMAELTKRQKAALTKHGKHHTAKHMASMRRAMKAGKSFTQSHKAAQKKVGK